jgi:hypothetical protein
MLGSRRRDIRDSIGMDIRMRRRVTGITAGPYGIVQVVIAITVQIESRTSSHFTLLQ